MCIRPAAMPTLQGTHARGSQACALRELFLRQARRQTQPSELSAECVRVLVAHTPVESLILTFTADERCELS